MIKTSDIDFPSVEAQTSAVSAEYRHVSKLIAPAPPITLGDVVLKWYSIAPADRPVPAELEDLARESLHAGVRSGALNLAGDLGFVILHRCGEDFYFLLVSTWFNENELWESVWAKDGERDAAFGPWDIEGSPRPTFCVWELGAVAHEQQAWTRFLRSARGAGARKDYLADGYEGAV